MLMNLQIKNFLLIEELELDFNSGLTVITGETGSGKSITIDALLLIFGAKANSEIIRVGQPLASFTASFQIDNPQIIAWLHEKEFLDPESENILLCRRVIDCHSRSKAYINSVAVNLSTLKELGEMLLDIHTQHASIALLKPENQRALLDEFAGLTPRVNQLAEHYRQVTLLSAKLKQAREFSQDLVLKQEILSEKIKDLLELQLEEHEWEELQTQQKQLANASFILQELEFGLNLLGNEQNSVVDMVATLAHRLTKIGDLIPNYAQISQLTSSIEADVNELERELQVIASKIEQDPERLSQVDRRIDEIYTLARKYRIAPEGINECLASWQHNLAALAEDTDLDALGNELELARQTYLKEAQQISTKRQQAAAELSLRVSQLLQQLSISGEFAVSQTTNEAWSSFGIDSILYQVCFNQGMLLQPLHKVASGGELSRVALALYVTLSVNNPPELIVFDEIDVGIGGGVAEIVGTLLKELGSSKQVICITHQAQTACCGDWHLRVTKAVTQNHSQTQIEYVVADKRIAEIARMLGGINITPTTLEHAKEMLNS